MRIGFTLPQFGELAHQADEVGRFAREAEAMGADSLWVADRVLAAVDPSVGYGGGDTVPEEFHSVLDPFVLMAVAAAATERVRIGSNVLIAPLYAPAVLARSLTTIDRISGGRLVPGLGTGWSPEEYQAAGVPMEQRGARLDECLDVLEQLWSAGPARYDGRYWQIPAAHVEVKPVQSPRPPVHLAGFAPAAIRRVARRADGWLPVHIPGAAPFDPESVNAPMKTIRELAADAGRDPAGIGLVLRINPQPGTDLEPIVDAIARAGRDTDVDHVFVDMMYITSTVDEALDKARRILHAARG